MPARLLALAVTTAALLAASPALGWDPALGWHTLTTPHFVVHYHDGLGPLAQRTGRALEAAHRRLVPVLGHAPSGPVQVVLSDTTDSANGSATAWVRPVLNLYAVPPDSRSELNDYEDYLWNLIVHEYTHILHLDDVSGLPWMVNAVLGQLWIPNGFAPRWYTEGLAVYQESAFTGSGRDRSSLYDMYLRTEVLEGAFFGVDDATGYPSTWPRGGTAYLHGARFMQWLADLYGPQVFARINHDYGSQVVPYAVNATAKDHLGQSYIDLYQAWQEDVTSRLEGQLGAIRQRGVTDARRLTFRAENTGEPVFLDDGRLLYLEDSADRRAALRRVGVDGSGDEKLLDLYGGGSLAVAPGGRRAVVSQIVTHRQFYSFEDLFEVDLTSGSLRQLTFGARLTEPNYSPDGRTLVAAQRLGGGRMGIVSLAADGSGPLRVLYAAPDRHAVYTPRFSPDGTKVAFSEQRPEGRDIRLLDVATGALTEVTRDRALDLDPTFDPTGRWLLFASDRPAEAGAPSGVYNLYAYDRTTAQVSQVTNVLTGAFRPAVSPDGRSLAFVSYSQQGYDVSVMALDPTAWRPTSGHDLDRPAPPDWETREQFPAQAYQPIRTLRPLYWLPLLGSDAMGTTLGFTTLGNDVLGKHSWSLQAAWGLASNQPSLGAAYSTQVLYPSLDLAAGTFLSHVPKAPSGLNERQYYGVAGLSFPFTRLDQRYSVGLGYELRYYDPWPVPVPTDPLADPPFRPDRGLNATLSLGLGFSNVQGYSNGISPERGLSLSLNLRSGRPEWGSEFSYYAAEGSLTGYLPMPWVEHHALALKLSAGYAVGELGRRRIFRLGGIQSLDPLLNLIQYSGISGAGLRGYAPGAFSGNTYTLANLEYRFPIIRVDAGLWTLPIYLKRIHAAVTFDVGEASDKWTWRGLRPSVGAELRAELYLGYGLYTGLRLGYARGLAEDGVNDVFFGLGNSF